MKSLVASSRSMLDKIRLALREVAATDETARALVHEANNIAQRALLYERTIAEPGKSPSPGALLAVERRVVEETVALNERVKIFCESRRIHYEARMSSAEIRHAIDTMPPGATEPPPSVREAILEAQFPKTDGASSEKK